MSSSAEGPAPLTLVPSTTLPAIKEIEREDLAAALAKGIEDFKAVPQFGLFFGAAYMIGGWLILLFAWKLDWLFLVFPFCAGFTLIGPFVAVGLYEVSRRRESGQPLTWAHVIRAIRGQSGRQIMMLGFALAFVLLIWMKLATFIYALLFGLSHVSAADFVDTVFTTTRGVAFLMVGNVVGAILAVVCFAISVMSFPFLLDRDADFATGIITSVRAVLANPGPMFAWGLVVAGGLATACVPAFLLLPIVLPVLGHATWHLYRAAIPH